jgi:CRISPR-associated protein Cas2
MPSNQLRLHLICYDIADPKRLGRVHRYLRKYAMPLQYSVFIAYTAPKTVSGILVGIAKLIEPSEDDIRCYTLPSKLDITHLGRQMFPDGVTLAMEGSALGLFDPRH